MRALPIYRPLKSYENFKNYKLNLLEIQAIIYCKHFQQ